MVTVAKEANELLERLSMAFVFPANVKNSTTVVCHLAIVCRNE